jgi:hypothetical protein
MAAMPTTHDDDVRTVLSALDTAERERFDAAHSAEQWEESATIERARADAAEADRDYWRTQATAAAPSVDGMRTLGTRLIPGGTGCVVDPERVVAAVVETEEAYQRAIARGLVVASERDAAEREGARLRESLEWTIAVRNAVDAMLTEVRSERDAARAEAAGLRASLADNDIIVEEYKRQLNEAVTEAWVRRAIVEGRATAPSRDEIGAHVAMVGRWLVLWADGSSSIVRGWGVVETLADDARAERTSRVVRWWPLDATGRPCAWPDVATGDVG